MAQQQDLSNRVSRYEPGTLFPKDVFAELARPFTPAALKFKVQATWPKADPKHGLIVSYMDARLVTARLNQVCAGYWTTEFHEWSQGAAVCRLTVYGVTREDIGKGGGFESEKAAFSDALKRAAVQFGVGAYLYSMAAVTLDAGNGAKNLKPKSSGGKKTLVLPDNAETYLRKQYARWLVSDKNKWGAPLDHNDEQGAVGDPVEAGRPPADETDLELAAAKQEADTFYQQQDAKLRKKFTPGRFRSQLEAAETTEAVDALVDAVKAKLA